MEPLQLAPSAAPRNGEMEPPQALPAKPEDDLWLVLQDIPSLAYKLSSPIPIRMECDEGRWCVSFRSGNEAILAGYGDEVWEAVVDLVRVLEEQRDNPAIGTLLPRLLLHR